MRLHAGLLILCISLLWSLAQPRYVYNPLVRNMHYFQEAGQSKLAAHWATGPSRNDGGSSDAYNHGFDLQGAYAISDHWAIMASYYNRKESDNISILSLSWPIFIPGSIMKETDLSSLHPISHHCRRVEKAFSISMVELALPITV